MTEDEARAHLETVLKWLAEARQDLANAQRRERGFNRMIDGYLTMFPSLEHLRPEGAVVPPRRRKTATETEREMRRAGA